jgi:hypothetical protein
VSIKTRVKELEHELTERSERLRLLLRTGHTEGEIEAEYKKLEHFKRELDALNESRQVLEFKRAMLRKIEVVGSPDLAQEDS